MKLSAKSYAEMDQTMMKGLDAGVFPGAVLLAGVGDSIVFSKPYGVADIFTGERVAEDTIFDLASLTKPLATTLGVMHLVQNGPMGVDQRVGEIMPDFAGTGREGMTVRHLLAHTSGLPAHRPWYQSVAKKAPDQRWDELARLVSSEPLEAKSGERVLYSDIGFMLLARLVEAVSGATLDALLYREIYGPLGVDLFFSRSPRMNAKKTASTENCPWRGRVLRGEVHDENAWAAGGVDGHAGLFGTAGQVFKLVSELAAVSRGERDSRVFRRDVLLKFFERDPVGGRALGFDMPASENSAAGRFFSETSVGHLGFTGTSFWTDLEKGVTVVLLANRVHPSRENRLIQSFRPMIHDTVMGGISLFHESD